jgi:hypothetical protein
MHLSDRLEQLMILTFARSNFVPRNTIYGLWFMVARTLVGAAGDYIALPSCG